MKTPEITGFCIGIGKNGKTQKLIERDCTLHFLGEDHTGKVLLRGQKWYDKDEPWFFFNEPRFPWKVSELIKEGGKIIPLSSRRKS